MSDHSLLSASSAERWLACPVSVTATDESRTSEAAAEGTALHAVSETVLRGGAYPEIGSTVSADGFDFEYDEHRHRDTAAYVDYVRSLPWVNGYNVEARVHYGQMLGTPHNVSFGTADCYGFTEDLDGRVLRIADLKMGRKPVNPEQNPQAILYAAGVLESLYPLLLPRNHRVTVTIFQPRLSRSPQDWHTTVGFVEDAVMRMRPGAQAALRFGTGVASQDDLVAWPELTGKHCGWCKRKASCNTFQKELVSIAQPGKQVEWNPMLFSMREGIKGYLEDLERYALDEALRGVTLPGTKLIRGKAGAAKLAASEDDVRKKALELGIENQIVKQQEVWSTPAVIRDVFYRAGVTQEEVAKYIRQPEGKMQVVEDSDPRKAIEVVSTSAFTGVSR
jgi:hypothetical protein